MKKAGAIIIAVIVTAVISVAAVFGIQRVVAKHNEDTEQTEKISAAIEYLDNKYISGDLIVFRVVAFSDEQLTTVKYSIDNASEVAVTATNGAAKNSDKYNNFGNYYIDSGAETVATSGLSEGEHLIKFYVYVGTTRYQVNDTHIFTIQTASNVTDSGT